MVDWRLAGQVARGVAGLQQPSGDAAPFAGDWRESTSESAALVEAYTRLTPATPLPDPEAVERDGWIDANLTSLAGVIDPVARRVGGPLGAAAGTLLAVQAGAVSGVLAARVLGQYEFPVLDAGAPARLLFVAPNLGHAAETLDAPPDQLGRWVALHEVTHALQFGGVPWLREYLAGLVRELLDVAEVDPRSLLRMPNAGDLRALADRVREGGIAALGLGAGGRELMDRAQAFMALLEGHAEHVMDAVGAEVLPDLPALRAAMDRRRRERSGLLRLLERLIGLDLKLAQYEQGKRFCDAVVAEGGIEALNRAWSSPSALPTRADLADPAGWLARGRD
jgi:coenzyme F420 biosynthesis associated uncharacterized protein